MLAVSEAVSEADSRVTGSFLEAAVEGLRS